MTLALPGSAAAGVVGEPAWTVANPHAGEEIAPGIAPKKASIYRLDRKKLRAALSEAPRAGSGAPALTISIPGPAGSFERFEIRESPVLEAGIASRYPAISTYAGRGAGSDASSIRLDLTPLGFHASVLSERGAWYVDPLSDDPGTYSAYRRSALPPDARPPLTEVSSPGAPAGPAFSRRDLQRGGGPVVQRTYRVALANDPTYATFFGGTDSAVLAAKTTLINRLNQLYNDDLAVKFTLINGTDELNLATEAEFRGANGPCGEAPCFVGAECDGAMINAGQIALGQLVGASNFDLGHVLLGLNVGGIGAPDVGGAEKAKGCSGVDPPTGDPFAIDLVAHEVGHQFGAPHTFNGIDNGCDQNRDPTDAVEPGSGSSILAYAGVCDKDNLQAQSDPYFSQRSIQTIENYVSGEPFGLDEIQTASFTGFGAADSFRLTFGGQSSETITNGGNYTATGIEAAIAGIPGWPAGASAEVSGYDGSGQPGTSGFRVTFTGSLEGTNVRQLGIASASGFTGFFGETVKGGVEERQGTAAAASNRRPVVTAPADKTIPIRTPFELEGGGIDRDGHPLVYTWEQNDSGGDNGTALFDNSKPDGPLFRMFSTASDDYGNAPGTDPVRTFPDLAQIAAGKTNAASGSCPAADVECFSEFLPTSGYASSMHFRLTARDRAPNGAGIGSDDVTLSLAPAAGPFLVTSHASSATLQGESEVAVTWNVAGTAAPPVSASDVVISFSDDGGLTYPAELAAVTPNDGSHTVVVPNLATTNGRFKVEAADNVFFDISDADLTVVPGPGGDNTAPQTTIDSGPPDGSTTNDNTPAFTFSSSETPSTFECSVDGAAFAACTSPRQVGPLGNGSHTFSVRATDAAGNTDASPASRTFTVGILDSAPPETTIVSGPPDKVKIKRGKRAKVVYEFGSDEDPVTFECSVDGDGFEPCDQVTKLKLSKGKHTIAARATDAAGNVDPTPAADAVKVKKKKKRR